MAIMPDKLVLSLRRSRMLAAILCLAHAVAGVLLLTTISLFWALAGIVVVGASLLYHLRLQTWYSAAQAVVAIELGEACAVEFERRDGARQQAVLLATSFVSPLLIILCLRAEGAWLVRPVLIAADALSPQDLRRLRLWLYWRCSGQSSDELIIQSNR